MAIIFLQNIDGQKSMTSTNTNYTMEYHVNFQIRAMKHCDIVKRVRLQKNGTSLKTEDLNILNNMPAPINGWIIMHDKFSRRTIQPSHTCEKK